MFRNYPPIFTDVHAFLQADVSKKLGLDLMAGRRHCQQPVRHPFFLWHPRMHQLHTAALTSWKTWGAVFAIKFGTPAPHLRPSRGSLLPHPDNQGFSSNNVFRVRRVGRLHDRSRLTRRRRSAQTRKAASTTLPFSCLLQTLRLRHARSQLRGWLDRDLLDRFSAMTMELRHGSFQ